MTRARRPSLLLVTGFLGSWAVLAGAAFAACARPGAPPGGPPDRLPPLVVGTDPDTFATVDAGRRRVRFRFSERISERPSSGPLEDAVRVSPATGAVRVEHDRRSLEVVLEGGFRAGLVYRVTILPVIQDLFGNAMSDPFELVFSTGAEFTPNVLAGRAVDRISGEPLPGVSVRALPSDDSLAHVAMADSAGIFALRFLPPALYRVDAYQDLNGNDTVDFAEAQASRRVALGAADTVLVQEIALLRPDTTPAVLASAEVLDSVSLELEFDDYLDPEAPTDGIEVALARPPAPDSLDGDSVASLPAAPPPVEGVYHPWALDSLLQARADSASRAEGEDAPPPEAEAEPGPERLPRRVVRVLLGGALAPGAAFRVDVKEVRNIYGLPGGGGTATIEVPAREAAPDTTAADSAAADMVAPDAAADTDTADGAAPDTAAPDTTAADSAGIVPDTLPETPRDTTGALPQPYRRSVPGLVPYRRSPFGPRDP